MTYNSPIQTQCWWSPIWWSTCWSCQSSQPAWLLILFTKKKKNSLSSRNLIYTGHPVYCTDYIIYEVNIDNQFLEGMKNVNSGKRGKEREERMNKDWNIIYYIHNITTSRECKNMGRNILFILMRVVWELYSSIFISSSGNLSFSLFFISRSLSVLLVPLLSL